MKLFIFKKLGIYHSSEMKMRKCFPVFFFFWNTYTAVLIMIIPQFSNAYFVIWRLLFQCCYFQTRLNLLFKGSFSLKHRNKWHILSQNERRSKSANVMIKFNRKEDACLLQWTHIKYKYKSFKIKNPVHKIMSLWVVRKCIWNTLYFYLTPIIWYTRF